MTHEIKEIFNAFEEASKDNIKAVLASVVALDGSSYRRPGVRMLVLDNGNMIGAVSGGCVEKEVVRQSQEVFETGVPKLMTYDGRYRLGCEGILYILLETFKPSIELLSSFREQLQKRKSFKMVSFYEKKVRADEGFGTIFQFEEDQTFSISDCSPNVELPYFEQSMSPCFKLTIIGAEHDSVQLTKIASALGWEVSVVGSIKNPKEKKDFPGAVEVINTSPEIFDSSNIDDQTAIVLMSHNFANDLTYLSAIRETLPAYIGLLGPSYRREKLLHQFLEWFPDIGDEFLNRIHGPAGLNLGAETPQEIAISIIAEILSETRNHVPMPLFQKKGGIHNVTSIYIGKNVQR